jgi:hypothetical protein
MARLKCTSGIWKTQLADNKPSRSLQIEGLGHDYQRARFTSLQGGWNFPSTTLSNMETSYLQLVERLGYNNNNYYYYYYYYCYLLQLGCYPVAVVILHVYKI